MGSFLSIFITLPNFKYSDVGNLRKFEYFYIFKTSDNARKYSLTSDRIFLQPEQRSYIFTSVILFSFNTAVIVTNLSRKVGPEVLCNFVYRERSNYFSKSRNLLLASFWNYFSHMK